MDHKQDFYKFLKGIEDSLSQVEKDLKEYIAISSREKYASFEEYREWAKQYPYVYATSRELVADIITDIAGEIGAQATAVVPSVLIAKDKNMNKKAYDDGKWDLPGPADKFQPGDEVLYTNPSHLLDGLDMGFPPNKDKSPTLLPAEIVSVDSTMGGYYIKVENQDGPPIFVEQHSLVAPNEAGQSHTEEMPPLGKHLRDQLGIDETHRGEPQEVPLKALVQKKAAFYGGYTKDKPQVVDMFGTKFEVAAEYPRSRDGRPTAITPGEEYPRDRDGRPTAIPVEEPKSGIAPGPYYTWNGRRIDVPTFSSIEELTEFFIDEAYGGWLTGDLKIDTLPNGDLKLSSPQADPEGVVLRREKQEKIE